MLNKQTVLVVDDVKENVDVLVELLKEYDLVTALDGQTALEVIEEEDIDLILLDIMMPEMDGFEVCSQLKSSKNTVNIPIIFLSAKDKGEDIQKGFNLGAVDYITKPFNPNELISRVNTHLKVRAYERDLEKKVKEEIEKNKLKQQMIYQQSKQASLGELLMHIAHQWKQPLTSLGSINLLNKAKIEAGHLLTKEENISSINKSEDLILFMSDTIETFKNFYKPSLTHSNFFMHEAILDVLFIVEATFHFDNIKIYIDSVEDEMISGNINEFSQVIFSIIGNARDIFLKRDILTPEIHINISNNKLSISDNGGGIEEQMIEKIFLANVSTTNSSGIGLYLSKSLLEKNNAIIEAQNTKDGAIFNIEFLTWID